MTRIINMSRDCSTVGFLSLVLWFATILSMVSREYITFAPQRSSACVSDITSLQQSVSVHTSEIQSNYAVPSIAWLMSFPNSGTSYTLRIVRQISNTTTATNYGDEYLDPSTNSSVSWENRTNGPFRAYPNLPLPEAFLLTKTHCASRCVHCGPDGYLETPLSFQRGCLRSNRVHNNVESEVFYSASNVRRAVHLMRNPLDNIVARFHLSRRHDSLERLYNNATGFHEWCKVLDVSYIWMEQHTRWIDPHLRHMWRSIPCHAEFFRWVQWHNLAYVTGVEMDLEVKLMKYEDYNQDWNETVKGLFRFLQLPLSKRTLEEASPFLMRSYHNYFTIKQKTQIRKLMAQYASAPVWRMIQDYFEDEEIIGNITKENV